MLLAFGLALSIQSPGVIARRSRTRRVMRAVGVEVNQVLVICALPGGAMAQAMLAKIGPQLLVMRHGP
jgi:hypothetical protein